MCDSCCRDRLVDPCGCTLDCVDSGDVTIGSDDWPEFYVFNSWFGLRFNLEHDAVSGDWEGTATQAACTYDAVLSISGKAKDDIVLTITEGSKTWVLKNTKPVEDVLCGMSLYLDSSTGTSTGGCDVGDPEDKCICLNPAVGSVTACLLSTLPDEYIVDLGGGTLSENGDKTYHTIIPCGGCAGINLGRQYVPFASSGVNTFYKLSTGLSCERVNELRVVITCSTVWRLQVSFFGDDVTANAGTDVRYRKLYPSLADLLDAITTEGNEITLPLDELNAPHSRDCSGYPASVTVTVPNFVP